MAYSGHTSNYNNINAGGKTHQHNGNVYGNVIYHSSTPEQGTVQAKAIPNPEASTTGKPGRQDYTVGWICALAVPELQASRLLLDEEHEPLHLPGAVHQYVFGAMNGHNVVMGCVPEGLMGSNPAAAVAAEMMATFPRLRFGLMVGVGGGVWSPAHDVRLGDVVVSKPDAVRKNGGVIQYDFGKAIQGEGFVQTGSLNMPPTIVLSALNNVRSVLPSRSGFPTYLKAFKEFQEDCPEYVEKPDAQDRLFKASYIHPGGKDCRSCAIEHEEKRAERTTARPKVHYGTIASGNQVIKDADVRDRIADEHDILSFEMEAAGLMNQFPCLVVRGICDYCDSHKNKAWQPFAAAAAAAWAKDLLKNIAPSEVSHAHTVEQLTGH